MNNLGLGLATAAALTVSVQAGVVAGVDVSVYAASAPHTMGPSMQTWVLNARNALRHDLANFGGDINERPTAYERAADTMSVYDMAFSEGSFPLWRGTPYPTGLFAGEYGNGLTFGLAAVATGGAQLSLRQVRFDMYGAGTPDIDGYHIGMSFLNSNYTSTMVGVQVGADGLLNTPDDVVLTSGSGGQSVDAIYSWGFSAIGFYVPAPVSLPFLNQQVGATLWCDWTVTHPLGNFVGTDSVVLTPAPGVLPLLGFALLARRRRS